MGFPEIGQVIYWLKTAGYRVDRGQPGEVMPRLEWPAVAVSLHGTDSAAGTRTVAAVVCTPTGPGGTACEDLADNVAELLTEYGGSCVQEPCRYDNWGNFFYVRVLSTWKTAAVVPKTGLRITMGINPLSFVTGFSARQVISQETFGAMGEDEPAVILTVPGKWELTLVEEFPYGAEDSGAAPEHGTLTVQRDRISETFTDCVWSELCREDSPTGLKQTRKGLAAGRSVTQ